MPRSEVKLKCRMASISMLCCYGSPRVPGFESSIARSYRLDSQSIFPHLRRPLFTARGMDRATIRKNCIMPPIGTAARRSRIVIIGAGFGGLSAAKQLAKAPFDVTIVDRHNYHLFQPLLYQVATAGLSPGDIASPIRGILGRQKNANVILAKVSGIDTARKEVIAEGRRIAFDYLIVATGAEHAYFGHDWSSYAPGLKTIDDAPYLRRRILLAFERAEISSDAEERRRLLNFVVVGGGPTGVEMAGAIAELAKRALASDFRSIDPRCA